MKDDTLKMADGSVESLKVRSNSGVGLRTISGDRQGFGFSNVFTGESLKGLVESVLSGSSAVSPDKRLKFTPPQSPAVTEESLGLFDDTFHTFPEEGKIEAALRIEEGARGCDERVRRVRRATYSESEVATRVVNSNGVDLKGRATYYSGSVTAVAEEGGESQMGWEMDTSHKRGAIDPEKIGRDGGRNALRMLGARKIKTVKCPAVIENTVVCELIESLAGSFLGDNVLKGKSMFIGKAGRKVASKVLDVWDDGVLPGGWAASVFDGEGALRQKTPLLTEGVCMGFLYDTYWAERAGAASTGNAARSNYKGFPTVGASNLYIGKGAKTLDELFKEIGRGLFITELMGVHTINTISGDFSLGASGSWIEGGGVAYPVRGMAISGNLLGLFEKTVCCAKDLRFIGSIGAPSLMVEEIEVSGA
ncbi:MAG: TldD/PmbA family protein [Deltaproteobacteria bacterium]|nr:TldD/PmbA family protein [Deltaproteobacteria bacterium]